MKASDRANTTNRGSSAEAIVSRYAFGELSSSEEEMFESQLPADAEAIAELDELLGAMTAIAEKMAEGSAAPRKSLKNVVLLDVMAAAAEARKVSGARQSVIRATEGQWVTQPDFPGFSVNVLYKDEPTGLFTVLAKLEPGAIYPSHKHKGTEQCYVVSGNLHESGVLLTAGDYIVAHDGSLHDNVYSPDGCLLLLSTMMEDEHLA